MVYRSEVDSVKNRHAMASEVALTIEIAESSLDDDRGQMQRIYAAARIPIYWIINLVERQVEVYEQPTGAELTANYLRRTDYSENESVPLVLQGKHVGMIRVGNLLP